MEAIRLETTADESGIVRFPQLSQGEKVEIIVLRTEKPTGLRFQNGWAEGAIKVLPGFDDPIPGMEEYT